MIQAVLMLFGSLLLGKLAGFFIGGHLAGRRRTRLMKKYQDSELVDRIMNKSIWHGQTSDQLLEAMGTPVSIDRKVIRSRVQEAWKYRQIRKGIYAVRIFVEDDVVVGWYQQYSQVSRAQ